MASGSLADILEKLKFSIMTRTQYDYQIILSTNLGGKGLIETAGGWAKELNEI